MLLQVPTPRPREQPPPRRARQRQTCEVWMLPGEVPVCCAWAAVLACVAVVMRCLRLASVAAGWGHSISSPGTATPRLMMMQPFRASSAAHQVMSDEATQVVLSRPQ